MRSDSVFIIGFFVLLTCSVLVECTLQYKCLNGNMGACILTIKRH